MGSYSSGSGRPSRSAGERTVERDLIRLDRLTAQGLEREGRAAGFRRVQRARVRETEDYVGSEVVILRG